MIDARQLTPDLLHRAERLLRVRAASMQTAPSATEGGLLDYCQKMYPGFKAPAHILKMIDFLERAARTPDFRGIITMPPRHGKSMTVSEMFPGWVLGNFPNTRFIAASHSAGQALDFSYIVRRSISDVPAWPYPAVKIAPDRGALKQWRTAGTSRGGYVATSAGTGVAGQGADILLIDDPIKQSKDADSAKFREDQWRWLQTDMMSRLQPGGRVILVSTRWHSDDLAGRAMKQMAADDHAEQWEVLHLPAIAEPGLPDAIDRAPGEALWPQEWPLKRLLRIRYRMSERDWRALYQGTPVTDGGNIVDPTWFVKYHAAMIPQLANRTVQVWDTAFKTADTNDFSVCVTGQASATHCYIVDLMRSRLNWPQLQRRVLQQARAFDPAEIGIEDKASGQSLIQWAQEDPQMAPYAVVALPGDDGKEERANLASPYWEQGRILIPDGAYWVDTFLTEVEEFPLGAHDDQIDAVSHLTLRLWRRDRQRTVKSTSWVDAWAPDDEEDDDAW